MQYTPESEVETQRSFSEALLNVRSGTHKLCVQTRDLHRALRLTGPNCSTLRLLLAKQKGQLLRAEAALAKRARDISSSSDAALRLPDSEPIWDGCNDGIDDKIMVLVQAHEAAAHEALAAARRAKDARDDLSYALLKRRADAHDAAMWALGPMLVTSVTACELCADRFTCPVRASLAKIGRRPTSQRKAGGHRSA